MSKKPTRITAILLALLVVFLWSTSWVLIKIGLNEIPAVTFAGIRYFMAFLMLVPFAISRPKIRQEVKQFTRSDWGLMLLLGIFYYFATQVAQYVGLDYLSSAVVVLLYNLSSILVALFGIVLLKEVPTPLQWFGVFINLVGILVFFIPVSFDNSQWFGLVIVILGVISNAGGALLSRSANRSARLSPLAVTVTSMGIGSTIMLASGLIMEGIPHFGWQSLAILLWLAAVNTAFAFTLWNYTLQSLTAMESSIINSLMLVLVALLAWIFLGEGITTKEIIGMALAFVGTILVQLRSARFPFLTKS